MKPVLSTSRCFCLALCAGLLFVCAPGAMGEDEESYPWQPFRPSAPWQEQLGELPAYPLEENLLPVAADAASRQFSVYLDKLSLSRGDDGVVRYTVVHVSPSGSWNVSNEGLHCGEREYRRYAYGFEGKWQPLAATHWSAIKGRGVNRYRKVFYEHYICIPGRGYRSEREILDSFKDPWDDKM